MYTCVCAFDFSDTWSHEQITGANEVITDVLEKAHAEHMAEIALLEVSEPTAEERAQKILQEETKKPHDAVSFWKRLFNCAKCELDDGTTGVFQADKKVGETINDSGDNNVEKSAAAADMKIERAYALEWVLAPLPDPLPNPMVTFICDPKAGNVLFEADTVAVVQKDAVDPQDDAAADKYSSEVEQSQSSTESASDKAEDSKSVEKTQGKGASIFKKVMRSIIKSMIKFGEKVMETMKQIAQLLFTTVRCAICVFCNLINMIVDLILYIKDKAMAALNFISAQGSALITSISTGFTDWKKNREIELERREKRVKDAEAGKLGNLGDYCKDNKHCVSDLCEISVVHRNECGPSPKQKEYRKDHCNTVSQCALEESCKNAGCHWAGGPASKFFGFSATCQCRMPKKVTAPTGPLRHDEGAEPVPVHSSLLESHAEKSGLRSKVKSTSSKSIATGLEHVSDLALERNDPKLAHLESRDMGRTNQDIHTLTHEQKMARAAYNLHAAGALDDHEKFIGHHLYNAQNAHNIMSSTVSMLQLSARAHESTYAHAAAKARGLVKLPNRCVGADKLGDTITLAINYENPSLFSCLMAIPFKLQDCMPELLVAISPIAIEGNSINEVCMAGMVAAEDAGKPVSSAELNKMSEEGMEGELMQKKPRGALGESLK